MGDTREWRQTFNIPADQSIISRACGRYQKGNIIPSLPSVWLVGWGTTGPGQVRLAGLDVYVDWKG